jgi:hypothetical protein
MKTLAVEQAKDHPSALLPDSVCLVVMHLDKILMRITIFSTMLNDMAEDFLRMSLVDQFKMVAALITEVIGVITESKDFAPDTKITANLISRKCPCLFYK